jgi:hypothetical protein
MLKFVRAVQKSSDHLQSVMTMVRFNQIDQSIATKAYQKFLMVMAVEFVNHLPVAAIYFAQAGDRLSNSG